MIYSKKLLPWGNDFGGASVYYIKDFAMEYSTTEFETPYIKCFPPLMRMAMSLLHVEDEARDVVQEVFLKLWVSNIRVENPMAFRIRSVRNACLNRINALDIRDKIHQRINA